MELLSLAAVPMIMAAFDIDEPADNSRPVDVVALSAVEEHLSPSAREEIEELRRLSTGAPPASAEKLAVPDGISLQSDLPVDTGPLVRAWIGYFVGPGRVYIQRWLGRLDHHRNEIERELGGLPKDLVYLPLIESGYLPAATSTAGAAGIWQFISSTGRAMGLRIDWWIDERRSADKSTWAAVNLLKELHRRFGDWPLAITAYNAGPGAVDAAIRNTDSRDLAAIVAAGNLSSQAKHFYPKLQAALIVGNNRELFGIETTPEAVPPELVQVRVAKAVGLHTLSRCADVSEAVLSSWNPELSRWGTPPKGYAIQVPNKLVSRLESALKRLPNSKRVDHSTHRVTPGETIRTIATRYAVSPESLLRSNHISTNAAFVVGMVLGIEQGQR